jgi:hypothetical protein
LQDEEWNLGLIAKAEFHTKAEDAEETHVLARITHGIST